jgi:hypothetical protein
MTQESRRFPLHEFHRRDDTHTNILMVEMGLSMPQHRRRLKRRTQLANTLSALCPGLDSAHFTSVAEKAKCRHDLPLRDVRDDCPSVPMAQRLFRPTSFWIAYVRKESL